MKIRKILDILLILINLILLAVFIYYKYRIGLNRYFDADEFAHLHWGFNFYSGMKPYKDFLYFMAPGYLLTFPLLFAIAGKTAAVLTVGRFYAFLVFLFFLLGSFLIFKLDRNWKIALMAVMILAFLPLPSDKLLEIRPDTLSTALSLFGIYYFIKGIEKGGKNFFLSGLLFGFSLMVVQKAIFFQVGVFGVYIIMYLKERSRLKGTVLSYLKGLIIPGILTGLFLIYTGRPFHALYLMTTFANKSTRVLGSKFPMGPNLFFYPVDAYYGVPGVSGPLIANLSIFVIAILFGIGRFMTFLRRDTWKEVMVEFLISISFIVNLLAFTKVYTLRHVQYMIPFAPFIAFYFSDLLYALKNRVKGVLGLLTGLLVIGTIILIGFQGIRMNNIKIGWVNYATFSELKTISDFIPKDSYVLDLFGQGIFYKDPYYICCIPYGQYIEAFTFKYPKLPESLEKTNTKYIIAYYPDRLNVLPSMDAKYITENYEVGLDYPRILVKKESK